MTMAEPRPEEYRRAAELRSALRRFLRLSEQVARKHRLTPQRYALLLMIKGAPDGSGRSTVTELSERLQLAQSTVTELVRRAEAVGLIRREQSSHDGRKESDGWRAPFPTSGSRAGGWRRSSDRRTSRAGDPRRHFVLVRA